MPCGRNTRSGSIHVDWQNGSTLAVVYGEDECRKVEDTDELC